MRASFFAFVLSLLSVSTAACSSSSSSGSGTSTPTSGPGKACVDTADAVAKAAQRCGGDYKANYDAFVKTAANGDCNNITSVRDEAALRGTCIPSFQTIACADLNAGKINAACNQQLVRKASFEPTLTADGT